MGRRQHLADSRRDDGEDFRAARRTGHQLGARSAARAALSFRLLRRGLARRHRGAACRAEYPCQPARRPDADHAASLQPRTRCRSAGERAR
jgi:hypothetical protein